MLLGIDFETTGLDTATLEITEVGAVLWDETKSQPIAIYNTLVRGVTVIPKEIVALNGITPELLAEHGRPLDTIAAQLRRLVMEADCPVAHNGTNFDRKIYERIFSDLPQFPVWIDTSVDVPYPAAMTTRKLIHLAAEHGFVNPFAHRAAFDVMTMLSILSRYDIEQVKASAREPSVNVKALVSYDDREKAKARGYRWEKATSSWIKTLKESQIELEKAQAGFMVQRTA